jgi:peptidoglycan/xylan/chitin deacetylase (PgdA/CDA1 family)
MEPPVRIRLGSLGLLLVTALTLVHCSGGTSSTPSGGSAEVIRHGDPGRLVVVLTFDAGYESVYTDQILDTLKEKGVKASFGMTGAFAERYPDLLRRIANEGHHLFNHSYRHLSFTGQSAQNPALTEAELRDEFDKTEAIIKKITGVSTKPYFRPPYGDYNDAVNVEAYARGYRYNILWSMETRGWQAVPPDQIIPNVLSQVQPGAIILLHLGVVQDAVALPAIIDGLRSMGYGFVTLPELIAAGSVGP